MSTVYYAISNDQYLAHHGVLGMKWGVRRYQNKDGSLTAAGRKKYGYNLDVNDKSRKNIAKIRKGEAQRRLDYAKMTDPSNKRRIAELQGRVRTAKKTERQMSKYDKGVNRAAKGETILGNKRKMYYAAVGSSMGAAVLKTFLNSRLRDLGAQGRLTQGHVEVAKQIAKYGSMALSAAATIYSAKKAKDNSDLRTYNRTRWTGDDSMKRVGSQEYADRKNQNSKKRS